MKKVKVYQTSMKECLTCSDSIAVRQFSHNSLVNIRGSDEFIPKNEIKDIEIPIEKYIFSQVNGEGEKEDIVVYAAFDDDLLKLIQCERDKFRDMNKQIEDLKESNKKLLSKGLNALNEVSHLEKGVCNLKMKLLNLLK